MSNTKMALQYDNQLQLQAIDHITQKLYLSFFGAAFFPTITAF